MKALSSLICSIVLSCAAAGTLLAETFVHDLVVRHGEEVRLTVETRGTLLNRGGEMVEFFVDGKSLGKKLSGGDGFAFLNFTARRTGIYRLSAKSEGEEGTGLLLSLSKGEKVLLVDVEGALIEGLFSRKARDGSQKVLKELSLRYPLIFLRTGMLAEGAIKEWLDKNGFIRAPVLPWSDGEVLDEIREKKLGIKAVIGAPGVAQKGKEYKAAAYTFKDSDQEDEGLTLVKDWAEIRKKLK